MYLLSPTKYQAVHIYLPCSRKAPEVKAQLCSGLQTFLRRAGGCEGERPCVLCWLQVACMMGKDSRVPPWPDPLIPISANKPHFPPRHFPNNQAKGFTTH